MTEKPCDRGWAEPLSLSQLMIMAVRGQRRAQLAALQPYGLSAHQARAFVLIVRWDAASRGEPRPSRLAACLHISPRSVTEVIDALAEKGLVQRRPSPTDRRASVIEPTAQGRSLAGQLHSGTGESGDVFAALTERERRTLERLLRKIIAEQSANQPPATRADRAAGVG